MSRDVNTAAVESGGWHTAAASADCSCQSHWATWKLRRREGDGPESESMSTPITTTWKLISLAGGWLSWKVNLNVQKLIFLLFLSFPAQFVSYKKGLVQPATPDFLLLCFLEAGSWHWASSLQAWLMRADPLSWHTINYFALGLLLWQSCRNVT